MTKFSLYHLESKFILLFVVLLNSVSLLTFALSPDLMEFCCICDVRSIAEFQNQGSDYFKCTNQDESTFGNSTVCWSQFSLEVWRKSPLQQALLGEEQPKNNPFNLLFMGIQGEEAMESGIGGCVCVNNSMNRNTPVHIFYMTGHQRILLVGMGLYIIACYQCQELGLANGSGAPILRRERAQGPEQGPPKKCQNRSLVNVRAINLVKRVEEVGVEQSGYQNRLKTLVI